MAAKMNHVSQVGFKPLSRRPLTPAEKMNAVLPFSKRPVCQLCGASTLIRTRKRDGEVFWACSTYTRCSGTIPIDPKKFKRAFDAFTQAASKP